MTNTARYANRIHGIYAKTVPNEQLPAVVISGFYKLDPSDYMVDFSLKREYPHSSIAAAFEKFTDNQLRLVEGSVYPLNSERTIFRGALQTTAKSVPYNEENLKNKTVITANVFKDDGDDSIWSVRGEGDSRQLVQQSDSDQSEILRSAFSAQRKATVASLMEGNEPEVADVAIYYNVATAEVSSGLIAEASVGDTFESDAFVVVDSKTKQAVNIKGVQILASGELSDLPDMEINAADASAGKRMLDYLRKLYGGKRVNQITELERVLRSHSAR